MLCDVQLPFNLLPENTNHCLCSLYHLSDLYPKSVVTKYSEIQFLNSLLEVQIFAPHGALVIYDRRLLRLLEFKKWLAQFHLSYGVSAGEKLKDLKFFHPHFARLAALLEGSSRQIKIVAVGGGSVTDFAGFLASTYKRGVPLILIPSTWLAALDSAHGGKTALNFGPHKNALGTFYFPEKIFIVKSLLKSQPQKREIEAYGELVKMALISGQPWAKQLLNSKGPIDFWKYLKPAVQSKYKIVWADPFEKKGLRQVLNLGHTLGHVLEKKHKLPHGIAVGKGLAFAVLWSQRRGWLKKNKANKILKSIEQIQGAIELKKLNVHQLKKGLNGDKKICATEKISFVFLKDLGKPLRKVVTLEEIVEEARLQGWVQ